MDVWTPNWIPLWTSLRVAALATLVSFPLALAAAWLLLRRDFRFARWIEACVLLLMVLTPPALGFLVLMMIAYSSPMRLLVEYTVKAAPSAYSETMAALAAVLYTAPLLTLLTVGALREVPREASRLGEVLGLNGWQVFWRITAPLSRRPLAAIAVFGFARAISEYGIFLFYGPYAAGYAFPLPLALGLGIHHGHAATIWMLASSVLMSVALLAAALVIYRGGRRG